METIENTSYELKSALIDAVISIDGDEMKIVGVGNTCREAGTVYLHLSSTTRTRKQKNGNNPVQHCDWFEISKILPALATE